MASSFFFFFFFGWTIESNVVSQTQKSTRCVPTAKIDIQTHWRASPGKITQFPPIVGALQSAVQRACLDHARQWNNFQLANTCPMSSRSANSIIVLRSCMGLARPTWPMVQVSDVLEDAALGAFHCFESSHRMVLIRSSCSAYVYTSTTLTGLQWTAANIRRY